MTLNFSNELKTHKSHSYSSHKKEDKFSLLNKLLNVERVQELQQQSSSCNYKTEKSDRVFKYSAKLNCNSALTSEL